MTEEELNACIRKISLTQRLTEARAMIARMCAAGRGPRMRVPVEWDDEDYFICLTLKDASQAKDELIAALKEIRTAFESYIDWNGPVHVGGCPQDDTCECQGKACNDAIAAAFDRSYRAIEKAS